MDLLYTIHPSISSKVDAHVYGGYEIDTVSSGNCCSEIRSETHLTNCGKVSSTVN